MPVGWPQAVEKVVADVGEEHDVDVLEQSGAHHEGLAGEKLLGHARPEHQRAGKLVALHQVLDRERGDDVDGLAGVVALAMAGRALDQLLAVGNAGLLRCLRDAVDVAAERDDGRARAPARYPGGRHAGNAALDGEAVLLQHVSEVVRGLELLEASSPKLNTVSFITCESLRRDSTPSTTLDLSFSSRAMSVAPCCAIGAPPARRSVANASPRSVPVFPACMPTIVPSRITEISTTR